MIHRVKFRNFKALRDLSLDLERLTVLVGPNSSGKTSVLEGIRRLVAIEPAGFSQSSLLSVPLRVLRTRGVSGDVVLECDGDAGRLRIRGKEGEEGFSATPAGDGKRFGPAVLLQLEVNQIRAASYSDEPVPRVRPDGEGLASVLAHMALNETETFIALQTAVQRVVPAFRAVHTPRAAVVRAESEVITIDGKSFTRQGEKTYWGHSLEFDMVGAPAIPAYMVSEGTLLVLALLTAMRQPGRPGLLLLDDIDRALHPKAQGELIARLRSLLGEDANLQIVATSHSPYLLDHLQPEEVRITVLRDDGSAACGRLDEHPEFQRWRQEMTPGEFWSHVGEKWLVDTRHGGRS